MYKQHEYDSADRCIHCGGSRALIVEGKWDCALVNPPIVDGPRKEIHHDFSSLERFVKRIPCVRDAEGHDEMEDRWSFWLELDISHEIVWHVIQSFAYVLNGLSLTATLPTRFFPTSAPPYLNGGPYTYLSWRIECTDPKFTPALCQEWLEDRLPKPVEEHAAWFEVDD